MALTDKNHEDYFQEQAEMKEITEQNTPYYDLVSKLIGRELRLSYSKLKHLTSPRNFINAILNPKKRNDGMTLGSLVDCILLTEDLFHKKYMVVANAPTTDKQLEFVDEVIERMKLESEEELERVINEVKNNGFQRVKTDGLAEYILGQIQGKDCISMEQYEKAAVIATNLSNADEIAGELAEVEEFQKQLEFEYRGWNFICFLDTFHTRGFHDLKFAHDCSPEKFAKDIQNFGYDIQFGLYAIGLETLYGMERPEVKLIVYDAEGNYSVNIIDSGYILYAKEKVDYLISCLEKMIKERAYDKSYDFFRKRNIIYKPQYVKGFDNSIFNN